VLYKEEAMREGMQIESAGISVDDKVRLLEALSDTGLKNIVVGSFVRPDYTPQMAQIDEIVKRFRPRPGVTYTALLLNEKAAERARQYAPPLTIDEGAPRLAAHLCDVFARRNVNRSAEQIIAGWSRIVARARDRGVHEAGIGAHAAWGSNFTGPIGLDQVMEALTQAHARWDEAGIAVRSVYLGDPMSWTTPHRTEELLQAVKARWPDIRSFVLHLHDGRGMALVSAYAALRVLGGQDTVQLEGAIGGIGGCPYCGNGRAAGMMATEDVLHMLDSMGIDHGVDLDRLVDCVWLLEEVLGRPAMGRVSKAGPRPVSPDRWYDPNLPFVETFQEARHFKLGPSVYEGQIRPWKETIRRSTMAGPGQP
jgi:hydroxymethylglutaryl-CoA lyase